MADDHREKHIVFEQLEPGTPVDLEHIEVCPSCRRRWQAYRILRVQLDHVPEPEIPPFFASRMARLVGKESFSLGFQLERAARRLAPVFLVLGLAGSFIVSRGLLEREKPKGEDVLLFEISQPSEVTLEDVVVQLSRVVEEERLEEKQ